MVPSGDGRVSCSWPEPTLPRMTREGWGNPRSLSKIGECPVCPRIVPRVAHPLRGWQRVGIPMLPAAPVCLRRTSKGTESIVPGLAKNARTGHPLRFFVPAISKAGPPADGTVVHVATKVLAAYEPNWIFGDEPADVLVEVARPVGVDSRLLVRNRNGSPP